MNSLVGLGSRLCRVNSSIAGSTSRRSLAGIRDWFGGKKDKGEKSTPPVEDPSILDELKSDKLITSDYEAIKNIE